MNNSKVTKERKEYLDGIKGLLCFLIMFGHYWNIYRGCKGENPFFNVIFDKMKDSMFNPILLTATFWMYAFLVISGYLLAEGRINSLVELIVKIINRFLRFFIPIMGACCFIFVIQECIGFHAGETAQHFTNTWFQKYYRQELGFNMIITETLKAIFAGSCSYNAPFWVIKDMFEASCIIYFCNYVDGILGKKTHWVQWFFLISAILVNNHVVMACLSGYLVGYYKDHTKYVSKNILDLLVVIGVLYGTLLLLKTNKVLPEVLDKYFFYTILYCAFIIIVERVSLLQKILSSKPFLFMGKINFGVYALLCQ